MDKFARRPVGRRRHDGLHDVHRRPRRARRRGHALAGAGGQGPPPRPDHRPRPAVPRTRGAGSCSAIGSPRPPAATGWRPSGCARSWPRIRAPGWTVTHASTTRTPHARRAPVIAHRRGSGTRPLDQTFQLHSKPGSQRTIYLDFNGQDVSNTVWNNQHGLPAGSHPAWSLDGDRPPSTPRSGRRCRTSGSEWRRTSRRSTSTSPPRIPGAAALTADRRGGPDLRHPCVDLAEHQRGQQALRRRLRWDGLHRGLRHARARTPTTSRPGSSPSPWATTPRASPRPSATRSGTPSD